MKKINNYIIGIMAGVAAVVGLGACQDDVAAPGINDGEATWVANTTIAELKEAYWQDDAVNYCSTIEPREDGSHVIIKGIVSSSDKDGNVFRKFVIQDATGALAISVYQYNNYLKYRMGQEVVLDVTGMYIGKYAGCMQLGWPSEYNGGMQVTFMPEPFLTEHIQTSGLPNLAAVDTLEMDNFTELGTNPADLRRLQSRLVRFNNVKFKTPGVTLSNYHENVDLTLLDASNNDNVLVRTSGYSSFWTIVAPSEAGDICGILDYYDNGSGGKWQLILIDANGLMNFGSPTLPKGSRDNPFLVADVVNRAESGRDGSGWTMGYIVGTVAPGIDNDVPVTSNDDIEWGADATFANTLVIAPDPSVNNWTECVVIELPEGSKLQQWGNLRANPDNLGRQIFINGKIGTTFGMASVSVTRGNLDEFEIVGLVIPEEKMADFDTFNGGAPKSSWSNYSSADGWTLTNGCILAGSADGSDQNPRFAFIGSASTLAPTLNGKASAPGRLVSPVLTGGCRSISFNYGFAFSETQCQFTVNVLQGGAVVKSHTVKLTSVEQKKVYSCNFDVNITGDFTIEIVNDALSAAAGNKDRVSIWNLGWIQ